MLLAEEFGVEYQRISYTAGMWMGFRIYNAPPHAAETLRVTFKQDNEVVNEYLAVDDDSPTDIDAQVKEYVAHLGLQHAKSMIDHLKEDLDAIEQAVETMTAIVGRVKPATNNSKPNEVMHQLPEDVATHGLCDDITSIIDRLQGAATKIQGLQNWVLEADRKLQAVHDQEQSLVQPADSDGNGASGAQA